MFEKEAEEAGNEKIKGNYQFARCARKSYKDGFKDGAEFGYKKARVEANEIIGGLMRFCRCFAQHHTEDIRYKEAEQFLRELGE